MKLSREQEIVEFAIWAKRTILSSDNDYQKNKLTYQAIRNGIFSSIKSTLSGYVSEKASLLPANKRTKEHFIGRKDTSRFLIDRISSNPNITISSIVKFLKSRSRVHETTKEENKALSKYHKENPNAHWRKAYRDCGIILKPRERIYSKVYIVDDKIYNTLDSVACGEKISTSTARKRFRDNKKFKNWIIKQI